MGGERCWRCGLRRLEKDERCIGCGATFCAAATARRRRATGGPTRICLGRDAMLAVREPVARPGRLFNIARWFLGVPSAFVLALWAYVVFILTFSFFHITGLKVLAYTLPFMAYPLVSLYCCVKLLPARKVLTLGIAAHLTALLCASVAYYFLGEPAVGNNSGSAFGWVMTLASVAAWAALYAGRLIDEGRLPADPSTQTVLGLALIIITIAALGLSREIDQRARDRERDAWTQRQ